jgi:hypothetical protein
MLSDVPRQQLSAIFTLNSKVADDDKLCEAFLRDYCGECRREIAALSAAVRWGVPKSLREGSQAPPATLRANLSRRLQENQGLDAEIALWAVDVWAWVIRPEAGGWPSATLPAAGVQSPPAPAPSPVRLDTGAAAAPKPAPIPPQAGPAVMSPPPSIVEPPRTPYPQSPVPYPQSPSPAPYVQQPPQQPYQQQPQPYQQQPPYQQPQAYRQPQPYQQPQQYSPPQPYAPQPYAPPLAQPQPPVPLLAAAQSFLAGTNTPELRMVQSYIKQQLKMRKPASLIEEMQVAGIAPGLAKDMVSRVGRRKFVLGIVMSIFLLVIGFLMLAAAGSEPGDEGQGVAVFGLLLFLFGAGYGLYSLIRLIRS